MKRTTVLFLVLALAPAALAQVPVRYGWHGPYGSVLDDPETARLGADGLKALYDARFDEAERLFDRIAVRHPAHPIGPFMKGLIVWWRILPDLSEGDREHDDAFVDAMTETIRRADRLDRRGPHAFDRIFFRAAALGFRGRLLSNRLSWFQAARDGKEALEPVFEIAGRDTLNPDFRFGRAVYDYFAAVVPTEYPMVRPVMLFFPEGDEAAGLQGLELAANHAAFVGTEAAYFLFQIHFQYRPDYREALRWVEFLRDRHPANGFFHVLEARVHARWGRWDLATPILESVLESAGAGAPGYTQGIEHQALYYLGRAYGTLGEEARALQVFERLHRSTTGQKPESWFRVWGRLRTAMVHDRAGRRERAVSMYREVLGMAERGDSRERARQYIEAPFGS
jgi:tetratricopeptide (TPR) repeat protein